MAAADPLDPLDRWPDPALLILTSLADGAKHGYAMTRDIADHAGVDVGPGTLYGALARLERQGLVEALPADERRRPYRLTAAGAAALERQLSRMRRVAHTGLARLAEAGGAP